MKEKKLFNLAILDKENLNKIKIDLITSAIAYRERVTLSLDKVKLIEFKPPKHLLSYFQNRLEFYRNISKNLPKITDRIYQDKIKNRD